jgi:hypothetical protein
MKNKNKQTPKVKKHIKRYLIDDFKLGKNKFRIISAFETHIIIDLGNKLVVPIESNITGFFECSNCFITTKSLN